MVKVGKRGAYARRGEEVAFVPAKSGTKVVDTTAAGDYFSAGFLYGAAQGCPLEQCLANGTVLANEIIQVVGTKLPETTWNRIKEEINARGN